MTTLVAGAKLGALAFAGFGAQKLVSYLVSEQLLARVIGKPEAAQPAAASGLEALQPYRALIGAAITFPVGAFIANKAVKDNATKVTLITGMALGLVHNLAVAVLNKVQPKAAAMLSGYEDGTAARLSAMYGVGASIMPHYTPLSEYFTNNGTSGYGEYFTNNGISGLGEYFTSGVSGLGVAPYEAAAGMGHYGQNPDMFEAAAGMGAQETRNTNHIDPNGDLERQLDIVEAAAGVGGVGVAPYEAAAGLGDSIQRVPSANTWIPGTTDGALWAGTRAINRGQAATEMVPAGILQTDGGQGVFG